MAINALRKRRERTERRKRPRGGGALIVQLNSHGGSSLAEREGNCDSSRRAAEMGARRTEERKRVEPVRVGRGSDDCKAV
eukprot:6190551-Pleurochrysis_carterae.AAC.2